MLAKAERELAKMEAERDVDSVFNFFVTAYHVMDYVKALVVPKAAIDSMYADPEFEVCQFICNKGKHLELKKGDKEAHFVPAASNFLAIGSLTGMLDLVAKWKTFFVANGI